MITITADDAIRALTHVVKNAPEGFVYHKPDSEPGSFCVYTHAGKGSCGVGQALLYLGVPFNVVHMLDTCREGSPVSALGMAACLSEHDVIVEPKAADVFDTFSVRTGFWRDMAGCFV